MPLSQEDKISKNGLMLEIFKRMDEIDKKYDKNNDHDFFDIFSW